MRQRAWLLLAAAGAVVGTAYAFLGEGGRAAAYDCIGVAALAACVVAARRRRSLSWRLLAGGVALFVAGDVLSSFTGRFPSAADVLYLLGYPLLAAALATMAPRGRADLVGDVLDAGLATAAAGLFLFIFWLEPITGESGLSLVGRMVACAYPLGDLLLASLLFLALLRGPTERLLAGSIVALLVSDLLYSAVQVNGRYPGWVLDLGWLAGYTLLGMAALRPSRRAPAGRRRDGADWHRLIPIGIVLFALPAAGAVQLLTPRGHIDSDEVIVFGTAIAALAGARLAVIARERNRSEGHFRALIETTNDVVLIIAPTGEVRYVSPSVERILGRPPETYVGRDAFAFVHPDDREALAAALADVRAGAHVEVRYRVEDSAGGYRTITATGRVLEHGPFAGGVLVTARDITQRARIEAELAEKEAQLRQAQKLEAIGQLAGGVAHDFNNLLTVISGYGEMARVQAAALGSASLEGELTQMLEAARRAGSLTGQLLAFSRHQRLQQQPLELNEAVRNLDRMLRRLIGEHIELVTLVAEEPLWLLADRVQFEQIVLNLAVNARDAMPDGGTLTIAATGDAGSVRLIVADTGHGMDEETQLHLFEPFFTTKGPGRGTGLGLATVYGIVAQSDGSIDVDSTVGAGTTFTVTFPRIAAPAGEEAPAERLPGRGSARVLLVEDEQHVRTIVARILRGAGYEVLEASEGEEGLRIVEHEGERLDLLLTDVVMPRLSGAELAARARRLHPRLALLFASGYANGELSAHAEFAQSCFLPKPFSVHELLGAVEAALGEAATETPAAERATVA